MPIKASYRIHPLACDKGTLPSENGLLAHQRYCLSTGSVISYVTNLSSFFVLCSLLCFQQDMLTSWASFGSQFVPCSSSACCVVRRLLARCAATLSPYSVRNFTLGNFHCFLASGSRNVLSHQISNVASIR